ncbi:MAG: DUF1289 domain-containing protein [Pseudomonadota bacterium]
MAKPLPSPCVDVCKYKLKDHCIACSMTKQQKSLFKKLKSDKHREAFVEMLISQQRQLGTSKGWAQLYEKRCARKGVAIPKRVSAKMG